MLKKKFIKIKIEQLRLNENKNYVLLLKKKKNSKIDGRAIGKNFFNKNNGFLLPTARFSSSLVLFLCYDPTTLSNFLLRRNEQSQEILLLKWYGHLLTHQQGLLLSPDTLFIRL